MYYSEETLEEVRAALPEYLAAVHGITNLRRNFRCLNPEHDDRDPSMSYYKPAHMCICHGCDAHADIFTVYGWDTGTTSFPEQVRGAAAAVGIQLPEESGGRKPLFTKPPKKAVKKERPAYESHDFSFFGQGTQNRITDRVIESVHALHDDPRAERALEALHARGFTDWETLTYSLGWTPSMADVVPGFISTKWHADGGFIVLPFWDEWFFQVRYCVFRPVGACDCEKEMKPSGKSGITAQLWNAHLLASGGEVYVTEGIFDAMALQILGGVDVVALCSADNVGVLAHELEAIEPEKRARLSIVMDNDDAGRRADEKAAKELNAIGARYRIVNDLVPARFSDANDWLKAVRGCA